MDLYFDLNLVQSQKVLLTPQLKQAYEILVMNSQELFEYVEEQLEFNPALEVMESINSGSSEICPAVDELVNWGSDFDSEVIGKAHDECISDDGLGSPEGFDEMLSLKEHLLFQLHTSNLNESKICIGEYLIDNIDENGYLTISISEVAEFFNINTAKVKKVLDCIQTFDPPGICARNLKECLLIQLKQNNCTDKDVFRIVEDHLDELAGEKIEFIAKNIGLSIQRTEEIIKLLKTLEPKPGREFYNNVCVKYTIPDIIIRNSSGRFEAVVNEDAVPMLNINEYYKKILNADVGSEVKKFILNRIESATWLLKCVEHRQCVLKKAAEYIISSQHDFLKKGEKYLNSIDVKSISEVIGVHESMIREILKGKYIQCLWGVFELNYFVQ